jgi:hypothetical protein
MCCSWSATAGWKLSAGRRWGTCYNLYGVAVLQSQRSGGLCHRCGHEAALWTRGRLRVVAIGAAKPCWMAAILYRPFVEIGFVPTHEFFSLPFLLGPNNTPPSVFPSIETQHTATTRANPRKPDQHRCPCRAHSNFKHGSHAEGCHLDQSSPRAIAHLPPRTQNLNPARVSVVHTQLLP